MDSQTRKEETFLYPLLIGIIFLSVTFGDFARADTDESGQDGALKSVELEHYTLQAGPIKIVSTLKNASGLTYNPLTKSLFLVSNRPTKIVETDLHGAEKRIIDLYAFHDTEGITHIKENTFAVIEEKRRTICIIEIDQHTTSIDRDKAEIIVVDSTPDGNNGLEGITYDPDHGYFYVVKEKNPRMIYQLQWPAKLPNSAGVSHPWNIQKESFSLKDLSGVYYHSGSRSLLILGDESGSVVKTTIDGKELGRLSLKKDDNSSLQEDIPQAEGIAMDEKGVLYICSEPDLLYLFNVPVPQKPDSY